MTNRIQDNSFVHIFRTALLLTGLLGLFAAIRILQGEEVDLLNVAVMGIPYVIMLSYLVHASYLKDQYIEWSETSIQYKIRSKYPVDIFFNQVKSINIQLDKVSISTEHEEYILDLRRFTNAQDRTRLKNFLQRKARRIHYRTFPA